MHERAERIHTENESLESSRKALHFVTPGWGGQPLARHGWIKSLKRGCGDLYKTRQLADSTVAVLILTRFDEVSHVG